jgi:hypothetical protein
MSRTVGAVATLGGRRYDTHALSVRVGLALLPAPDRALIALPAAAGGPGPGDDAKLELDDGDGLQTVLTGHVAGVRRDEDTVTVTLADAGALLAAARPGSTSDRQDAGAVVRSIAAAAGVDISDLTLDLGLAIYVAGQRRTGAEHVALLAGLGGCLARVDADGRLAVITRPAGPPDVALRWGREISSYRVTQMPAAAFRVVPVGSGSAGSADADGALRPSTSPRRGDASGPAVDTVLEPAPLLRSPGAVASAGAAAAQASVAAALRLQATSWLQPQLRPGVVIEVSGTPDGLEGGPWLVVAVTHELDPRSGGSTRFQAQTAGADVPGGSGLLAMAASAVGGLL